MPLLHEFVQLSHAVKGAASRVYARATQGTADGTRNLGDEVPVMGALGVTSMPSDDGNSRGVLLRNVSGAVGVVVAAVANGLEDLVGNLLPGDTCLHGTGPKHGTRLYMKEQVVELVITGEGSAPDVIVQIDRPGEKAQIVVGGHVAELSQSNGLRIDAAGGQASLIMKDDFIWLKCARLMLTDKATVPIAAGTAGPTAPAPITAVIGPPPG